MARGRNYDDTPLPKLSKATLKEALYLYKFIRPYKWSFVFGLILLFISSSTFMFFPYMSGVMVDIAQGKSNIGITLNQVGLILVAVFVLQGFVSYFRVLLFAKISEKGLADIRMALYSKLVTLPYPFFDKSRVGELVSRLNSDIEKLYNTFSVTLAEFLRQILILISGVIFLAITTPKLSLIMLATFPVIVVFAMIFGRSISKMSKLRQEAQADSNIILNETLTGIQVVKAFANELFETARFNRSTDKMVVIAMKFAHKRALFAVFIIVMLFGALFFVLWEGALMLQRNEITAGGLVSFVTYTAIIGAAIAGLGNFFTELMGAVGATERVREILMTQGEIDLGKISDKKQIHFKGEINYENVFFSYPSRLDVPVLKGVDLHIRPGEKIALVGPSGAGKSTIVQLLLQFYKISEGHIKVDGQDINNMDLNDYRRNFAIVPQEVLLFGGTIKENILYGKPDATPDEIMSAAKKANAWEFIATFPEQMETIVGERGIKLSGGQRQRIAIARAILRDPAILILDEATSSLDAESEKVVQEALNALMEGRTSIIIAHRLATIKEVDRIYVLDKGKIIETGTHEELSRIEDGLYNHLAKLQFDLSIA